MSMLNLFIYVVTQGFRFDKKCACYLCIQKTYMHLSSTAVYIIHFGIFHISRWAEYRAAIIGSPPGSPEFWISFGKSRNLCSIQNILNKT